VVANVTAIRHLIERLPDEPTESRNEPTESRNEPTESRNEPTESRTEAGEAGLPIVEEAKPVPEERKREEPSRDGLSSFDGLSMDLGPLSMESTESEPAETADAGALDEEGTREGLMARDLRKTKEEVTELKRRLKEAVTAAQDAVAANERLNALRRTIDGKDPD
jgi:hypothetical protein